MKVFMYKLKVGDTVRTTQEMTSAWCSSIILPLGEIAVLTRITDDEGDNWRIAHLHNDRLGDFQIDVGRKNEVDFLEKM